jgi:hypothetical protein
VNKENLDVVFCVAVLVQLLAHLVQLLAHLLAPLACMFFHTVLASWHPQIKDGTEKGTNNWLNASI